MQSDHASKHAVTGCLVQLINMDNIHDGFIEAMRRFFDDPTNSRAKEAAAATSSLIESLVAMRESLALLAAVRRH